MAKTVGTVTIAEQLCKGCDLCVVVCPEHVLAMTDTAEQQGLADRRVGRRGLHGLHVVRRRVPGRCVHRLPRRTHEGRRTTMTTVTPVATPTSRSRTKRFASGNEAVIDAALAAGCHFFAGYPVTPATEILEAAAEKFPANNRVMVPDRRRGRRDPHGGRRQPRRVPGDDRDRPAGTQPDVGGAVVLLGDDRAPWRRRGAAAMGARRRQPRAWPGRLQPGDAVLWSRRLQDDRAGTEERAGAR